MKNKIKHLRIDADLTQQQLADALKINVKTLASYESETNSIPDYVLLRIADFFKVTTDYILCHSSIKRNTSFEKKELIDNIINKLEELKKM